MFDPATATSSTFLWLPLNRRHRGRRPETASARPRQRPRRGRCASASPRRPGTKRGGEGEMGGATASLGQRRRRPVGFLEEVSGLLRGLESSVWKVLCEAPKALAAWLPASGCIWRLRLPGRGGICVQFDVSRKWRRVGVFGGPGALICRAMLGTFWRCFTLF